MSPFRIVSIGGFGLLQEVEHQIQSPEGCEEVLQAQDGISKVRVFGCTTAGRLRSESLMLQIGCV